MKLLFTIAYSFLVQLRIWNKPIVEKLSLIGLLLLVLVAPKTAAGQNMESDESWRKHVVITNLLQINTERTEYSPAFFGDGIVYPSSRRKNGPIDKMTGETYHDLYYAPIRTEAMLAKAKSFSLLLNGTSHEGPVTFNTEENTIYFSRTNPKRKKNQPHRMNIYEATRGERDWEDVKLAAFNDGDFSYMHPSISPTGDRLFFTSDMPGGFGATDIYMVERVNGKWSRPINLGPNINTPDREAFPFIHPSGVLFFASDGHEGAGGYDIFLVNLGDPNEMVVNLGSPFNSVKDDFGFILDELGKEGYFSSNRAGGVGGDDIYSFNALDGIDPLKRSFQQKSTIQVEDANSGRLIPLASVRIVEKTGTDWEHQIYDFEYRTEGNTQRLLTEKQLKSELDLPEPNARTNRRGEVVHAFQSEKEYLILASKNGYETVAYDYSTKGKIEAERIYISMSPIACFDLKGNVVDAQWQPLKDAEVFVTNGCDGSVKKVGVNVKGAFIYCLEIGCDFSIVAKNVGYDKAESKVSTRSIRGSRSMEIEMVLEPRINSLIKEPIKVGTTIVLEKIYYDFNTATIQRGAAEELEELASLMLQYPTMEVELIAHTDSRGESLYNLELSQKRARAAKEFLMRKGVATDRIKTFGYGEAKIRNHCKDDVDCTEEEHGFNRRTEVRVIRVEEPIEFKQKDGQ